MPYDPALADRIRSVLDGTDALTEKKMFGGVGFMIGGNMAAGAHSDGRLMVRVSKETSDELAERDGASLMVQGGRTMRGWVLVDPESVRDDEALAQWVGHGRDHAASLPPK